MTTKQVLKRATPPTTIVDRLMLAAIATAGALIGFGITLWVAANWHDIPVTGRLAMVGSIVAAAAVIAIVSERARVAAAFVGILGTGGLLAIYGQAYQTGADPWELFAIWAALSLLWALPARNDAIWCLFVIIAQTALGLWVASSLQGPGRLAEPAPMALANGLTMCGWAIAVLIAVSLNPAWGLRAKVGRTYWAFRLAVVLAVALVVTTTLNLFFERGGAAWPDIVAVLVLAMALVAISAAGCFDFVLAGVVMLGLDALAMAYTARALLPELASGLSIGLLSTALTWTVIFGVSAVGLKALGQYRGNSPQIKAEHASRIWPVTMLTTIGAIVTAMPVLGMLGLMFEGLFDSLLGYYVVGLLFLCGGVAAARWAPRSLFVVQLASIALVVGLSLLASGLMRDIPVRGSSLVMLALVTGLALVMPRGITALLGGAAAAFMALLIIGDRRFSLAAHPEVWTLLLFGAAVTMLLLRSSGSVIADWQKRLDTYCSGWTVLALMAAVYTSGPTFLGGGITLSGLSRAGPAIRSTSLPVAFEVTPMSVVAVLTTVGAMALIWKRWPWLASRTFAAVGLAFLVAAFLMPSLAGPIAVFAAALVTGRRILAIGAAIAALWIAGTFYYWFGLSLTVKAALLVGLGLALAMAVWLDGGYVTSRMRPSADDGALPAPLSTRAAFFLAGLAIVIGLTSFLSSDKADVIARGRTVFVALAPVDPRSLMQGDYMTLAFQLPVGGLIGRGGDSTSSPMVGFATIDARGVATVERIAPAHATRRPGEHILELTRKNGRLVIATDAFYFKEGTGARYENARFGVFRLAPDGRIVLVGLADESLVELR